MTTWTTIHLPTVLHFHPGSLATNQHLNMKLLTLSKGWWLFESTSTQELICHIKEWHRVSWVDSTAKGTRLNGRRKYKSRSIYFNFIMFIYHAFFCWFSFQVLMTREGRCKPKMAEVATSWLHKLHSPNSSCGGPIITINDEGRII